MFQATSILTAAAFCKATFLSFHRNLVHRAAWPFGFCSTAIFTDSSAVSEKSSTGGVGCLELTEGDSGADQTGDSTTSAEQSDSGQI